MINGIFSKGFEELSKYFDSIYCTNSYSDFSDLDNTPWFLPKDIKEKVKQLNVF